MLINLTHVIKSEDKVIQTEARLDMNEFVFKSGTFPIAGKTPVSLTILNRGNQELQISGKAAMTIRIPCGRCLEDVKCNFSLDFEKEVDMKMQDCDREKALDECDYIDGYNLDVDKLVRSEILMNWPMKVLCSEACKGICLKCGTNLNLSTCGCDNTALDPRMAKILDVYSKFKEV